MNEFLEQQIAANQDAIHLGVALMLGTLIGLQRGWQTRERDPGQRVAGIRTHALTGLLGGVAALLARDLGSTTFAVLLVALVLLNLTAYWIRAPQTGDYSITGVIGLLLTFCFGAMAVAVDVSLAAAAAVITVLILDNKDTIHRLLQLLHAGELNAGFKLLVITVVVLPLLPNKGMGPGGVLNPYEIWWLVILIASISFVGYFAVRIAGAGKGILFTSLFAGLSSSTALTLHFSRQARDAQSLSPQLASGILIACGTMFPRILIYCGLINPALLPDLLAPVISMMLVLYLPAAVIWFRNQHSLGVDQPMLNRNPLDLQPALVFGLLLTLILLVGHWLSDWFGDAGIYILAATSGIADVDAITLSLTRMSAASLHPQTAVLGIVIASAVNNLVKATIAWSIGPAPLGRRVALPMALSLPAGLLIGAFLMS